ncbi:hypothetical protein CISG_09318 [Coccidioides immitis RMSCC 3703]|uniref:Uncharacterized protein n=2 Tax=Coccidioides immitis TaxID=5501 RepID=A0A0J8RAQ7_COCIT|nr:hypothetical protein CIRG_09869 [Coccidioides immitis RMSCC 2394]KMU81936.1 hypothetical protein CISG_09318 [Coccidioides immitis RMSCC 3703]
MWYRSDLLVTSLNKTKTKTVNRIICNTSSDIPLSNMNKKTQMALLEEFTANTANIKMPIMEKHGSDNRLIADSGHLKQMKIDDNDNNNEDFTEHCGNELFNLNQTLNTTGAEASDYLTACSQLNLNSNRPIISNVRLEP